MPDESHKFDFSSFPDDVRVKVAGVLLDAARGLDVGCMCGHFDDCDHGANWEAHWMMQVRAALVLGHAPVEFRTDPDGRTRWNTYGCLRCGLTLEKETSLCMGAP